MEKRELLKNLRKLNLGGVLRVNGKLFKVSEVVSYLEYPDRWFDLVHYQPDGREIVVEIEGQELSFWRQVKGIKLIRKRIVRYRGERYQLDPKESGEAETILRKMENGKEVAKVAKTPYTMFAAPSGRLLCQKFWDGKECWYFSEPGLITISI